MRDEFSACMASDNISSPVTTFIHAILIKASLTSPQFVHNLLVMANTSVSEAVSLEPERNSLLSSILTLSEKIKGAVKQAREDFKAASDVYDFISTTNVTAGIRKLFIMPLYIECFNSVGVKTRAELEKLWAKHYKVDKVREAVEELLEHEESMHEFAVEVDRELSRQEKKSNPVAKVGQQLPRDLSLIDAETGLETRLDECWEGSKFTWFVFLRHFG